jgi:hypothetical protein
MSCNNTNSTCTSCNHNYSSCNNKCAKCGCKDSFLTSPPPCPTPAGCPDPIPCQEVLSSDCIIYNGPDISCNGDVIITSDSTWEELLEDLVAYFCTSYSTVPLIICGADVVVMAGSDVNSALQQIVTYFCDAIVGIQPITANNGLVMSTSTNVKLGGALIQNTTLTNSTFALNINSTTVPALTLDKTGSSGATLLINNLITSSPAILANSNITGLNTPVVQITSTNTGGSGTQALGLISNFNSEQSSTPPTTIPTLLIQPTSTTAAGTANACGIRVESKGNTTAGSGVSIEFENPSLSTAPVVTNRLVSKTVVNTNVSVTTSKFIIQGKASGVNPLADQLTLQSTGQLQLNNYGVGNFTGTPAYNLSTTGTGNIIETTAGLFGTAFRASSFPVSRTFVAQTLANSEITNGVTIKPTSAYQIVNGATVTTMYDVATGIWTCPQSGYYDINYNLFLTAPSIAAFGWGDTAYTPTTGIGQFFIGVTNNGTTTYCADSTIVMNKQYLFHLYITGGQQGVYISATTTLVLKIQNMTGVNYVSNSKDNIDWAIRRVG